MGFGSGKKPIPDPGSRVHGQKGTGSRIRIRNTEIQFCRYCNQNVWVINKHVADPDRSVDPDRKESNWKFYVRQRTDIHVSSRGIEGSIHGWASYIEVSEDTMYLYRMVF